MHKKLNLFIFLRIICFFFLTGWLVTARAQTVVGTRIFTSQMAGAGGATIDDMVKMDRNLLYSIQRSPFGIMGTINAPGGKITIKIFADDDNLNVSQLIFQISITVSSPDHYSADLGVVVNPPNYLFGAVRTNDPYTLAMTEFTNDYPGSGIIPLRGKIPVVVEVTVTDASFTRARLPGIGIYTLDFPWRHPCFGDYSPGCNELREFRMRNSNNVMVVPSRGVWGEDETCEGGMEALRKAHEENYSFTKLDIRLSKDGWPLLLHDQEINRMTNLPSTPDQCDPASVENLNAYNSTTGIPVRNPGDPMDQQYGLYPNYPALSEGRLKDRYGNVNWNEPITDLATALNYIAPRKISLILDIQEKDLADYLNAMYVCLKMAKERGLLHRIIFKHGSAPSLTRTMLQNFFNSPHPDYPGNSWSDYAYRTSTIITIHPSSVDDPYGDQDITDINSNSLTYGEIKWGNLKTRIDDWMELPSVIGFEVIFKCEQWDPMLTANISPQQTLAFLGKSVVRYIKDMSYRTGNQWEIPTECRGIPNGQGSWYGKSERVTRPYATYSQDCYDLRGNPEWVIQPPGYMEDIDPGFIITDRPDIMWSVCEELERFNLFTFVKIF